MFRLEYRQFACFVPKLHRVAIHKLLGEADRFLIVIANDRDAAPKMAVVANYVSIIVRHESVLRFEPGGPQRVIHVDRDV